MHNAAGIVEERMKRDVTHLQSEVSNLERILQEQMAGVAQAEKRLAVDYLEHGKPLPAHIRDYLLKIRWVNDHRLAQLDEYRDRLRVATRDLHRYTSV